MRGNQPPTAVATATPTEGTAPLDVSFDATGSSDPDGETLTFAWDLDGDGAFDDATGAQPSWTYTQGGTHVASVEVSDPQGATDTASVTITVNNTGPTASIDSPSADFTWLSVTQSTSRARRPTPRTARCPPARSTGR